MRLSRAAISRLRAAEAAADAAALAARPTASPPSCSCKRPMLTSLWSFRPAQSKFPQGTWRFVCAADPRTGARCRDEKAIVDEAAEIEKWKD